MSEVSGILPAPNAADSALADMKSYNKEIGKIADFDSDIIMGHNGADVVTLKK